MHIDEDDPVDDDDDDDDETATATPMIVANKYIKVLN
jgi:hypothetical protein